jgi:catechol 2,3-dioxygenase-like lactoylglutathione lyase family enzyme
MRVEQMKLNHLHIKTENLAETREFYENYFGFKQAFDHGEGAFLMDEAGFLLAIFPYKKDEPRFRFPEWFHFGFCMPDEDTVRNLYMRMRNDGTQFVRPMKVYDDGTVHYLCLDPAGNRIEVSWNAEESQIMHKREPLMAGSRR